MPTIPHVAQYVRPKRNTETTTTHLAIPNGCTAPAAYREPIKNMMPERPMPPVMADVRLPHLSASKKAGTDIASMSIPETPDARNEAVAEDSPACENSRGAYYHVISIVV